MGGGLSAGFTNKQMLIDIEHAPDVLCRGIGVSGAAKLLVAVPLDGNRTLDKLFRARCRLVDNDEFRHEACRCRVDIPEILRLGLATLAHYDDAFANGAYRTASPKARGTCPSRSTGFHGCPLPTSRRIEYMVCLHSDPEGSHVRYSPPSVAGSR